MRIYKKDSSKLPTSENDNMNHISGINIFKLLRNCIFIILIVTANQSYAQVNEAIKKEQGYIITKFPYSKTKKFEQAYCEIYSDYFNCKDMKDIDWSLFDDKFNLADSFFIRLCHRPITHVNYDALNIAGLYLREKRPKAGDLQYEYTYLDIELDTLTNWIYVNNDPKMATNEKEVEFKRAYLALLRENLFIIDENTYSNELSASNNFKGAYYKASRKFVIMQLQRIMDLEYNSILQFEIEKLIKTAEAEKNK